MHAANEATNGQRGVRWDRYRPSLYVLALFVFIAFVVSWLPLGDRAGYDIEQETKKGLAFALVVTVYYSCAFHLTDHFPLSRSLGRAGWMRHVITASLLAGASRLAGMWLTQFFISTHRVWVSFLMNVGCYFGIAVLIQVFRTDQRRRRAESARLQLQAALLKARRTAAEAQVRAFKADVHSRFILGALADIRALAHTDIAAADHLLGQLGSALRALASPGGLLDVSLQEEYEALEPILEARRAGRGGHLLIETDLSPDARDAFVPSLLLHDLVECLAEHRLLPEADGRLRIAARREGVEADRLEVIVQAMYEGLTAPRRSIPPDGLEVMRSRMMNRCGPDATFEVATTTASAMLRLTIPWHDVHAPANSVAGEAGALEDATVDEHRASPHRQRTPRRVGWSILRIMLGVALFLVLGRAAYYNSLAAVIRHGKSGPLPYNVQQCAVVAALLTLEFMVAMWLTRHVPWRRPDGTDSWNTWKAVRIHVLAGAVFGLLQSAEEVTYVTFVHYSSLRTMRHLGENVFRTVFVHVIGLVFFSTLAHLIEFLQHHLRSNARPLKLRAALDETHRRRAESELRALKAELNPHFVGNTLNAVSGALRTDIAAAERILDQLADLIRSVTVDLETAEVTLEDELRTLESFLTIERERWGPGLDVRYEIEPRALKGRLPHMILQPLMENAVKHGLAPHRGVGRIAVSALRKRGRLQIAVHDDGVGLDGSSTRGNRGLGGVGLSNTRARLLELYGQKATFELLPADGGGTIARVTIPWREKGRAMRVAL